MAVPGEKVYQSAQASEQNIIDLEDFSNRLRYFFTVLEAKKFKSKVPADFVLGGGSCTGLHTATFSMGLHVTKNANSGVSSSSYRGTIQGAPPS